MHAVGPTVLAINLSRRMVTMVMFGIFMKRNKWVLGHFCAHLGWAGYVMYSYEMNGVLGHHCAHIG